MKNKVIASLSLTLLVGSASAIDLADDGSLKLTGFYSVTGAKVLDGSALGSSTSWSYQRYKCPCSIQNWEYTGVYEKEKG